MAKQMTLQELIKIMELEEISREPLTKDEIDERNNTC